MHNFELIDTSELDSHADAMRAGSSCKILALIPGITARLKLFSDDMGAIKEVAIGTVATSYVHPISGERFTLIFHEALIFEGTLKSSLMNLNQM